MLFDSEHSTGISVSFWVILFIIAITLLIALLIGRLIVKDFTKRPSSGPDTMIDKEATVIEWDGYSGRVKIYEEIWNAYSDENLIINDKVTITKVEGLNYRLRNVHEKSCICKR